MPEREHTITARRALRTRRTRELVELAQERFSGCDVCRRDDSYELIDDVLRPLRLPTTHPELAGRNALG